MGLDLATVIAEADRPDVLARLLARAAQPDDNGCRLWTAGRFDRGYGMFYHQGRMLRAHRVAYHLLVGPIPADLIVCHTCDTPPCVEQDHLFLGTNKDNTQDMLAKGRHRTRAVPHGRGGRPMPGMANGRAKLTDAIVRHIRISPICDKDLAAFYGVSDTAVRLARQGKTWRHVDQEAG